MTKTFHQFINDHNGKYLTTTPKLGPQCVALIRYYCEEVLGLSKWTLPCATYAYQIFDKFPDVGDCNFTKIRNTPTGVPKRGDIIFSRKIVNGKIKWQHVSIFSDGDVNKYISFDQNWPKGRFCCFVNHNYEGVIGWLHPKTYIY